MNNIFSTLSHSKDPGIIREFVLWCIQGLVVILSLVAIVTGSQKTPWVLLVFFVAGLMVMTAFRLTLISLLYSDLGFLLILFIVHFICFKPTGSSLEGLCWMMFCLLLILALAIMICFCIHVFTRYMLLKAVAIMAIIEAGFLVLLQILLYVGNDSIYNYYYFYDAYRGYWVGTTAYIIMLILLCLYHIFFAWGYIENKKNKFVNVPVYPTHDPYIRCVYGSNYGKTYSMRSGRLTIGSDPYKKVDLLINDVGVLGWHCEIRYVNQGGRPYYAVLTQSPNSVWVNSTDQSTRYLVYGKWNNLPCETVICIGSFRQQYQLL